MKPKPEASSGLWSSDVKGQETVTVKVLDVTGGAS